MILSTSRTLYACVFLIGFAIFFPTTITAQDKDKEWRPVTPAELADKTSTVEADADAEAIFWEVKINDSSVDELTLQHYIRVKIFTERGREKYSKLDVPFTKGLKIKNLAARVIKSDGSIVEIKNEDIFEREIVKASGVKVKAKSFAVPNIEPGVIVEYRYKEIYDGAQAKGMRLAFQRDLPVRKLSYLYKPWNKKDPQYQSYNFSDTKFVKDKDGYWLASRIDVPAYKEEPKMPPDDTVRAWMFLTGADLGVAAASAFSITYVIKDPRSPSVYWGGVGAEQSAITKFMNKGGSDVKKMASELTANATTTDEKLRKIYAFCQTQIANTTYDSTLTDEQRKKLPETKSFGDLLKRKSGNALYIDLLFGSLANAAGLETRIVLTSDRSKMFMTPDMTNEALLHLAAVAVKVDSDWKYFDPGVPFLPYGMLAWNEEDAWALLIGEKNYDWKKTPLTSHETSVANRSGQFTLLEDGTLEGDVSIELNGQQAVSYRMENYDDTPAKREENFIADVKRYMGAAEISKVTIENLMDSSKPVVQKYSVRVPNYAQKTGKRLFLQPGYFTYGASPLFASATRKYDVFFGSPWSEVDSIQIKWPDGYDLDHAESPGDVGDPNKIGLLKVDVAVDKTHKVLKYDRKFHFGGGGGILFDAALYKPIKGMFDAFNKSDTHTITLKQK